MLRETLVSILGLSSLLPYAVAAPTRTHCRCIIVDVDDDARELATSPPLDDLFRKVDVCANLGPELEYFQDAEPELYQAIITRHSDANLRASPTEEDMRPIPTTVLMKLAAKDRVNTENIPLPSAPTGRPQQRILCHSVPEAVGPYHDSQTTLLVLQVIVALAILGCVAEAISLLSNWLERGHQEQQRQISLVGSEQRLRAFSAPAPFMPSEKTQYPAYLVQIDYADDDDDEINRPVM